MLALVGSIFLNSMIGIIFKLFDRYSINTVAAVVVNYVACVMTGYLVAGDGLYTGSPASQPWLIYAVLLGVLFLLVFMIFARSVQYFGIMTTSIFQKMSLVAPVLIGILAYGESAGWIRWSGILLSVVAIILANYKTGQNSDHAKNNTGWVMALPLLTFAGSCMVDSALLVVEHNKLIKPADAGFVTAIFLFAGISGFIYLLLKGGIKNIRARDIIAGLLLGVPYFFSIYLLLLALQAGLDGSVVFPVNNVGVLLIAGLSGMVIFGEKASGFKITGFVFALLAIIVISLE